MPEAAAPPALPIPAEVDDDSEDPGPEAAPSLELPQRPVDLEKGLLSQVTRLLGIAEQADREVVHHSLVQSDEARERLVVALAAHLDEGGLPRPTSRN